MVLADVFRTVPVEAQRVLVLTDAVVKPANLERYVLKAPVIGTIQRTQRQDRWGVCELLVA